jgi:hypothetical protein
MKDCLYKYTSSDKFCFECEKAYFDMNGFFNFHAYTLHLIYLMMMKKSFFILTAAYQFDDNTEC